MGSGWLLRHAAKAGEGEWRAGGGVQKRGHMAEAGWACALLRGGRVRVRARQGVWRGRAPTFSCFS